MSEHFDTHTNPPILSSVRHTIPASDTIHKYYGEIRRNADAAWVLCGNEGAMCNERIVDCDFKSKQGVCNLKTIMALVGLDK